MLGNVKKGLEMAKKPRYILVKVLAYFGGLFLIGVYLNKGERTFLKALTDTITSIKQNWFEKFKEELEKRKSPVN